MKSFKIQEIDIEKIKIHESLESYYHQFSDALFLSKSINNIPKNLTAFFFDHYIFSVIKKDSSYFLISDFREFSIAIKSNIKTIRIRIRNDICDYNIIDYASLSISKILIHSIDCEIGLELLYQLISKNKQKNQSAEIKNKVIITRPRLCMIFEINKAKILNHKRRLKRLNSHQPLFKFNVVEEQ